MDAHELHFERGFIDRLLHGLGEPFADTSALAVYFLCQQVRPQVKVALSGDGGDELFFGYKGLAKQRLAQRFRVAPAWARRTGIALTNLGRNDFNRRLNKYLRLSLQDDPGILIDWVRRWEWSEMHELLGPELFAELFPLSESPFPEVRQTIGNGATGGFAEQQLQFHMKIDLPCDMLFKVDRMSMAHGLEVRVPMLANQMLEFGQHLPLEIRTEASRTKEPLRTLAEMLSPTQATPAPKHGFSFPLDSWLRGELADCWREWELTPVLAQAGFQPAELNKLVGLHESFNSVDANYDTQSTSSRLFDLLLLAVWMNNNRIEV